MDLVSACRVLVEVAERGSVTQAALALGVAQSVASRRILALEDRLGGPLLERSARRAVLTPFGRDLVPPARRLVRLADELELDAERARLRPITVAVPTGCGTRDLAVADAAAREAGLRLEFRTDGPARRSGLAATAEVRVAVVAVPAADARWTVEVGVAGRQAVAHPFRLDGLRPVRRGAPVREDAGSRLRTGPEDDVSHVRDVLTRAAFAAGVLPGQVPVDGSVTAALAAVLADGDLLLCSVVEAEALGLHWRPIEGLRLVRGHDLVGESDRDVRAVLDAVQDELAAAVGAAPTARARQDRREARHA
ncbi:LysR family transcriptional regulator [Curtobacterium sp. RRHDQ10]|uniref:LysR family transcriptional regulator n=1 Tax=Curtobacterium phyllosphaerae TaxID=3413379 RepID=UPI003BF0BC0F